MTDATVPINSHHAARHCGTHPRKHPTGFSVLELLLVLGIVAVMASFSTFAISSLTHSRYLDHASREIAGLIEQSQIHAVANQQPVWLGFANLDSGSNTGVLVTAFAEVESATGDLQFEPLSRPKFLSRVSLGRSSFTTANTTNILDVSEDFNATLSVLPVGRVGATNHELEHVIRIGVGGDIQTAPNNMPRRLEIVLMRSDARAGNGGVSRALAIDGLMGSIEWIDYHAEDGL